MVLIFMLINIFMTGAYHGETSLLICTANQWTGFYMIDLRHERVNYILYSNSNIFV